MTAAEHTAPRRTPLYPLHLERGARMVEFAGYAMPVQYGGIVAEHLHTRSQASLFDVSHMGQVLVRGDDAAAQLERLLPVDLEALAQDQCCYTFFTTSSGGVLDDLIVTRRGDAEFMLVLNASRVDAGLAHLRSRLSAGAVEHFPEQALLALQGPRSQAALCTLLPDLANAIEQLRFMRGVNVQLQLQEDSPGFDAYISRSGYTGEDGFEISLPGEAAARFARALLDCPPVEPAGLGARDSLRLEAALCLYGHDLDENTSPVEAGLGWSIDSSRRSGGSKAGGSPGADLILGQLQNGAPRKRTGFVGQGRAPVREGAVLVDNAGIEVGVVTSGGFSPSLQQPIAMAYVQADAVDRVAAALVRGKARPLSRCKMPFVAHNTLREKS